MNSSARSAHENRSILVYCPGYPFDNEALKPDRQLASIAGSLLEAGHRTQIYDYGTVENVDRLTSDKVKDSVKRVADRLMSDSSLNPLETLDTLWRIRSADRTFQNRLHSLCHEIANRLRIAKGINFVCLKLNSIDDLQPAIVIAGKIRAVRPKLRIVAVGPFVDVFGAHVLRSTDLFDCLCISDHELSMIALAEKIDTPTAWSTIPNLVFSEKGQVRHTYRMPGPALATLPAPAYEPEVYPALKSEQKLKLFDIEDVRGARDVNNATPRTAPDNTLNMKPVPNVCDEMWRLGTVFGTRAFHLTGSSAPASHVSAVAHEIVRRGITVTYSREGRVDTAVPASFPNLEESGCVAMSYDIASGSQRLLDEYYNQGISVTKAEEVLKASREAGMYTIARFTYPCPADDFHTRCETLRLIARTKPHAAPLALPNLLPLSAWFLRPKAFDFGLNEDTYLQQSVRARRKFPLPEFRWRLLPYTIGQYSSSQVMSEYDDLVRDVEENGVVATITESLARIARLAGYAEREREFGERVQCDFLNGDAAGIATLVNQFNEVACVSAKRVALRPSVGSQPAVANN